MSIDGINDSGSTVTVFVSTPFYYGDISMLNTKPLPLCGGCIHSRRAFLAGCAGCLGVAGTIPGLILPTSFAEENATDKKMTVRIIFSLHTPVQDRPDWPNVGFDFNPVMESTISMLKNGCKDIGFVASMAANPAETKAILDADAAAGNIDGYVVMQLNCWNKVMESTVNTGKPVLFTELMYAGSGGMLLYSASMLRAKKPNFAFMPSSRSADVVAAANCLLLTKGAGGLQAFVDAVTKIRVDAAAGVGEDMKCIEDKCDLLSTGDLLKELKTKKMLEFEKGWHDIVPQTKETLGIEIVHRPFTELNDLWEKADKDQAMEIVKRWKRTAAAVIDVQDDVLEQSARMYLAMQSCLKNHDACAITINCLGGFYGGHIHAYPCLGFYELLNEGLIGACECDTMSTLTMIVGTTLTKGRPGYISDPVMDVATKQIIYAHCVASNKPFGPQKALNPFTIMTHSEDRQGASVRSTLPVGYMTTTLEIAPGRKEILFHRAKTVANSTDDRACRTKIAAVPVGDFEKLFKEWDRWGWHRVTFYGDLKEPVFALADALGFNVIEET